MSDAKTVLLIGASRGLGLALAEEWLKRGWAVIATVRGASPSLQGLGDKFPGRLTVESLEMNDPAAIDALRGRLAGRALDLLFVNAAVALGAEDRVGTISTDEFCRLMITNALSPMRVVERLGDLVRPAGTIGVMSSMLGSVGLNEDGGWEVYRSSKSALNQFMRSYAARHRGRSLAVVDPGWVQTDMGGPSAHLTVDQSIPGVVDALERHRGQQGLRYFNYKDETVAW